MAWPRERQIEFPREQTHLPSVTVASLGLSVLCIVIVVIILLAGVEGPFIGHW